MKQITVKELYELVKSIDFEDKQQSWWTSKEKTHTLSRLVSQESSDHNSFYGYRGRPEESTTLEYYKEKEISYRLNLCELLKSKGYGLGFYPIRFKLPTNCTLIKTGCFNLFETAPVDDALLNEFVEGVQLRAIKNKEIEGFIRRLSEAESNKLYTKDIPNQYKELLFKNFPSCDFLRQIKVEVRNLVNEIKSLIQESDRLFECIDLCKNVERLLQDSVFTRSSFRTRKNKDLRSFKTKLASTAHEKAEHNLANVLYTELISDKNQKASAALYLARAWNFIQLNAINEAYQDAMEYKAKIGNKTEREMFFRVLIFVEVAKNNYGGIIKHLEYCSKNKHLSKRIKHIREQVLLKFNPDQLKQFYDALLAIGKNHQHPLSAFCRDEYCIFIQLSAERDDAAAQMVLSQMLWDSDRFIAEKWLYRAADNGNPEAQYNLAEIFRKKYNDSDEETNHYLKRAKGLLEKASKAQFERAQDVLHNYYATIAASVKTDEPIFESNKKRKLFMMAIDDHANPFSPIAPDIRFKQTAEARMDIVLDSKNPAKRIRMADTTPLLVEDVEQALKQDKSQSKHNYVAANLSLIFANATNKEARNARLTRTISIKDNVIQGFANIETVSPVKHFKEEEAKNRHKNLLSSAIGFFKEFKDALSDSGRAILDFIPVTEKKAYNPYTHKHSENALYQYLTNPQKLKNLIEQFIEEHKAVFEKGTKVYGVVIDIYSNNASCTDCKRTTFALQNSSQFLKPLQEILEEKGYPCLSKRRFGINDENKLYFLIRIRAGKKYLNRTDSFANMDNIPDAKDLKQLCNRFFFHQIEMPPTQGVALGKNLIFESGTNAPRQKK